MTDRDQTAAARRVSRFAMLAVRALVHYREAEVEQGVEEDVLEEIGFGRSENERAEPSKLAVADVCAAVRLGRMLSDLDRPTRQELRTGSPIVFVRCPEEDIEAICRTLAPILLGQTTKVIRNPGMFSRVKGSRLAVVVGQTRGTRRSAGQPDEGVGRALADGYVAVGVGSDATALPTNLRVADIELRIDAMGPQDVINTCMAVFGEGPTDKRLREALGTTRAIASSDLMTALSPARGLEASLQRLARIVAARSRRTKADITLDDLPGLGPVGEEARDIAADLRAVVDGRMDAEELLRGVVLHGPPGGGKTSLARAIAATAGVPLVIGGLDKWQSSGEAHLGTTLKALRADFNEARANAPCILLIDEIDGFGRRDRFSDHHKTYSAQVVNGLLSQLDGPEGRSGVLVIGTTNEPADIDPAIVRSGRFDRIIEIALPDEDGLLDIFHHYAPELGRDGLRRVLSRMIGASGADIEALVRRCRARARRRGAALALEDIAAILGDPTSSMPLEVTERIATHEAGHALALVVLGMPLPKAVRMTNSGGDTLIDPPRILTKNDALRFVEFLLAGRAAEELLFGQPGFGSGGGHESDLARATTILLGIEASHGLGDSLVHFGSPEDIGEISRLRFVNRAETEMSHCYARIKERLTVHRVLLERVAEELRLRWHLSRDDVLAMTGHLHPDPDVSSPLRAKTDAGVNSINQKELCLRDAPK